MFILCLFFHSPICEVLYVIKYQSIHQSINESINQVNVYNNFKIRGDNNVFRCRYHFRDKNNCLALFIVNLTVIFISKMIPGVSIDLFLVVVYLVYSSELFF